MKTSLATTLSVIGVLAAGGVALAVNTTVLDSTVSSVEGPSPLAETLVPGAALSVDSTIPVVIAPIATETTVVPASVQSAYDVQGVGIITLEQNATSLTVVSVNPVSGWYYDSMSTEATSAEIKFTNGTRSVMFSAELLDGQVVTAVQATDVSFASQPKDDDDEDDEDDEDEDDEEDDDDDDEEDDEEEDDDDDA